jgi:predicted ATPase
MNELAALKQRYGPGLDAYSHGESYLTFFEARFVPNGLYLLEEPEAALSPKRQLTLISLLNRMVGQNAQFIIATHSPIILAYPGAAIYSFDQPPIRQVQYDELEHVWLTRSFLGNPQQWFNQLLRDHSPNSS